MAEAPQIGDIVGGKYRIESELGRGGMGVVFRARHTLTDRAVALKWMVPDRDADAASVQRFLQEARAMGRIEHPNVVGVLDVGLEGEGAYLVMELLRGRSLRSFLSEGKLSPELAVSLLLPAIDGVSAAHAAGVIHRDLKPENLFFVEGDGSAIPTTKVLDFGISKLHVDGAPSSSAPITATGATIGTPSYMSPEQVRGSRDIDARTDVWALGAILYELLAARVPFQAGTYSGLLVAIVIDQLVPVDVVVPDVPSELARIVERALQKEPADRWPDVMSLRRALAPFAARDIRDSLRVTRPDTGSRPSSLETVGARGLRGTPPTGAAAAQPPPGPAPISPIASSSAGLSSGSPVAPEPESKNASVSLSVPDVPIAPRPDASGAARRPTRIAVAIGAALVLCGVVALQSARDHEGGPGETALGSAHPPLEPAIDPQAAQPLHAHDAGASLATEPHDVDERAIAAGEPTITAPASDPTSDPTTTSGAVAASPTGGVDRDPSAIAMPATPTGARRATGRRVGRTAPATAGAQAPIVGRSGRISREEF
jgi:serine/threonine protein kinase